MYTNCCFLFAMSLYSYLIKFLPHRGFFTYGAFYSFKQSTFYNNYNYVQLS